MALNFNTEIDRANRQFGRMFPGLVTAVAHEGMTLEEALENRARRDVPIDPEARKDWTLIATIVYDTEQKKVEYVYPASAEKMADEKTPPPSDTQY